MDTAKLLEIIKAKKAKMNPSQILKPQPGKNRYVILPGWRAGEPEIFFRDIGKHFIKNEADVLQAVYLCHEVTHDRPCAVCESIRKAMRMTKDDDIVKVLKKSFASRDYLLNVLALDSSEPNTPQILQLRGRPFEQLFEVVQGWSAEIFNPENAVVVEVTRNGAGFDTTWSVQPLPTRHKVPAGIKVNDLDAYVSSQENESTRDRAIEAIGEAVGLMPPSADVPRTSVSAMKTIGKPLSIEDATMATVSTTDGAISDIELDSDLDALLNMDFEEKDSA